jgi:AcrR family transcriptional regulator
MGAIAQELGAPTGSIYHRFGSRDILLAEVWLHTVEAFQTGFVAELAGGDPRQAGLNAALYTPRWVRAHRLPARLLLLHHRDDFLPGGWPPEVADRALRLTAELSRALRSFARGAFGSTGVAALLRARFAVVDIPGAAVRPHLRADEELPVVVEDLVRSAYLAIVPVTARRAHR